MDFTPHETSVTTEKYNIVNYSYKMAQFLISLS